jgi:hypothetical protein
MHTRVIVAADEFLEYTAKMLLVPDQYSVKTLPANYPYQPLDVRRGVGCALS